MRRNTCTLIIFVILSVLSTKYVSAQSINTSEDYFIEGVRYYNEDNLEKAIEGLDIFTKNWCMNCAETEKKNDLVFRCEECDFAEESGSCRIKGFVNNHKNNYHLDNIGSMGRL